MEFYSGDLIFSCSKHMLSQKQRWINDFNQTQNLHKVSKYNIVLSQSCLYPHIKLKDAFIWFLQRLWLLENFITSTILINNYYSLQTTQRPLDKYKILIM